MKKARVGLMVARIQPLHKGHCSIINHMIEECEIAIVCIGSAQKSREKHDPWTVEERMDMLKNVYGAFDKRRDYLGSRIKLVPLADIGAANPQQWIGYILDKIKKLEMPEPTDYFTGSEFDAAWFRDHFAADWRALEGHVNIGDDEKINGQPAMANEPFNRYLTEDGIFRRLHNLERQDNRVPSATELRGFMELRVDDWKEWVPHVNHGLIMDTYPDDFKVPVNK